MALMPEGLTPIPIEISGAGFIRSFLLTHALLQGLAFLGSRFPAIRKVPLHVVWLPLSLLVFDVMFLPKHVWPAALALATIACFMGRMQQTCFRSHSFARAGWSLGLGLLVSVSASELGFVAYQWGLAHCDKPGLVIFFFLIEAFICSTLLHFTVGTLVRRKRRLDGLRGAHPQEP